MATATMTTTTPPATAPTTTPTMASLKDNGNDNDELRRHRLLSSVVCFFTIVLIL
jgi:hypothetical protein